MKISFNPEYKIINQLKQNGIKASTQQTKLPNTNLNVLECISNYNIPFCSRGAVYAINYDGNYEKIKNAAEAGKKYSGNAVYACLNGQTYASSDKVFIYADEIENEDGEINSDAIQKAVLNFKYANNQPIYSIDINGHIERFDSPKDAYGKVAVSNSRINQILEDTLETSKGYTFVRAFDVELRDKNGKLLLDEDMKPLVDIKKINKAREKFLYTQRDFPVIMVSADGETKPYKDLKDVADDIGTAYQNIAKALSSTRTIQDKYILLRLSDVVKIDESGNIEFNENNDFQIDYNKIKRYIKLYLNN